MNLYKNYLIKIVVFIFLFLIKSLSQNISIRSWVSQGYYYSHKCQVNLQIISNYFQSSYQLFHILSKQNTYFYNATQFQNVFYIKATNAIQAQMTSSQTYCRFPMSSTYYCPFISINGYDPYGIKYFQNINSTHRKLTIRLSRVICAAQASRMVFRVQMPSPNDYSSFYMFVPGITDSKILTVDKLSFVYDKQIEVNMSSLGYKQVREINFMRQSNYIVGCKVNYEIGIKFSNLSYYDSFDEITVYIQNGQVAILSQECTSNISKSYNCYRTSYGYKLVNLNSTNMMKSYEIAQEEYYQNDEINFKISFGLQLIKDGQLIIQVIVKSDDNNILQSWLNMSHNSSQIYGREMRRIKSYNRSDFIQLSKYSNDGYDPLKCITPIILNPVTIIYQTMTNSTTTNTTNTINNTSNSTSQSNYSQINNSNLINNDNSSYSTNQTINPDNSSNNTSVTNNTSITNNTSFTNNTSNNVIDNKTNNTVTPDYTFTTSQTFQINQLIFFISIIIIISLTLYFTSSLSKFLFLLYLLTTLLLSIFKIIYLLLSINQDWLLNNSSQISDSFIKTQTNQQYSLQIFIIQNTFILYFILNLFYFFNYLILLLSSQQLSSRIKKYYGTKYFNKKILSNNNKNIQSIQSKKQSNNQQNSKLTLHKCNGSSIIFTLISFITFLVSFKIFGILILKLQLNINSNNPDFIKYRFRNSVLYKIHKFHLILDLIIQLNLLIWIFLLTKSCQNESFYYVICTFLIFYCIHVLLSAKVLKIFYLFGKKTDEIKKKERNKLQNTSHVINQNLQATRNVEEMQEKQEK